MPSATTTYLHMLSISSTDEGSFRAWRRELIVDAWLNFWTDITAEYFGCSAFCGVDSWEELDATKRIERVRGENKSKNVAPLVSKSIPTFTIPEIPTATDPHRSTF